MIDCENLYIKRIRYKVNKAYKNGEQTTKYLVLNFLRINFGFFDKVNFTFSMPKIIKILTTFDIFEPDLRVLKRNTLKYKFLDKLIIGISLIKNLSNDLKTYT